MEFTKYTTHQNIAFAELPALAKRLGVNEVAAGDKSGRYMLSTPDGHYYDMFDLLNAFLDKLDKVQ